MAVYWRQGFRRLLKGIGLAYWGIVLAISPVMWWNSMRDYHSYEEEYVWHWNYFGYALTETAKMIGVCALVYLGCVIATRLLRWVARGFLDSGPARA